ncbi:PAS domain S-box-containing protein [Flavobacterium sp. 90]|uniref:PAS domain S-box protein n=1 Tax=unclassified Flavobacterium TaxID=196869 RepID=UPI000EAC53A6|nr:MULTISPECIES: PAS domain S-box protein [unclassified Flavobacterium]RKR11726.1 PAS domain S-box-containing protein [Flavobacterium sp. 81]TCK55502.1 PAS domain S-box-containing protein [Flavobacterium sp. 90]
MVANCSFFNSLISGIALISNVLKSIITNWYVYNSDIIFYNNPKLIILGLSLLGFLALLVYQFFRIKARIGYFIEKKKEAETASKEYQLYILFFGIAVIVIEIINEIFKIRPKSLLIVNVSIGFTVLLIYLITDKVKWLRDRIQQIFIFCFFIYITYVCYNIVRLANDVVPVIVFLISFFFSYNILKPIRTYWFFVALVFVFLLTTVTFHLIPIKSSVLLINFCILIFIINQVKYAVLLNNRDNFRFANEIVHKGNSLTIATNQKGAILFCSETVSSILGYLPDEVMGFDFWKLTKDEGFIENNFPVYYQENKLYIRKLKSKNGEYKYIQWKDKKFSEDLIISIGQDVTEQINVQDQYKNLIQTATDIIFEIDANGHFTFINEFGFSILGYSENEIISKHYSNFIHENYIRGAVDFYENLVINENNFPTIEFPVIKKNGLEVWISQKIIVRKNDLGETVGFAGIARDITEIRNIENEKKRRLEKIEAYNNSTKKLSTTDFSKYDNLNTVIDYIVQEAATVSKTNRVSFWKYYKDLITCKNLFSVDNQKLSDKNILDKESYPIYFETLKNKAIINAPDVFNKLETSEFQKLYFTKNHIKSMLDVPVFLSGQLAGVVCFESTEEQREWDNEDINYARTISDVISLAISSQMRLEAERKLEFKSQLLSALSLCTEKFLLSKTTQEMFQETYDLIGKAAKVDHMYYYERDFTTNTVSQKYKWSKSGVTHQITPLRQLTEDNLKEIYGVVQNKKILNTLTRKLDDTFFKQLLIDNEIKSILILPLYINDIFTGFIGFDDCTNEKKWSEEEIYIFQVLANNISSALERNRNENKILESEEKFKLIANNIPGTVYLSKFDAFSTKIFLNDEILNLTGYSKSEFIENNLSFLSLIHPDDKEEVINSQIDNLQSGMPLHNVYRIQRKTGEYIWVEEFGDVIKKGDEIEFVGGIYFDITNKKETEDAIKAKQLAEAANKSKSDFLANMSHEIRTPLNGIIGFTHLLMKTELEAIQEKYMTTINQSAHSLLEIINDILDFSKIEAGKLELFIDLYDIKKVLGQVFDLIVYESNQKNLQLELNVDQDVPKYIWTDIVRIKQILINLLSNAVKFTNEGSIKLNVSVLEKFKSNNCVIRFSVIDTGIGILEKNQKKIFKAFSQEDSSTTRKFGGTGLGLTISNQLLALMESRLQLESKIDIGSNFYFDLNLKTSNQSINEKYNAELKKMNSKADCINKLNDKSLTFLIVEDNKVNMMLLKTIIKNLYNNAFIYECENGYEAVQQFENINPNMVFMDIQMPIMNGYETTKAIRNTISGRDIPIIAVTAGAEKEERNKCISAGMNDYISKPIMKGTVEDALTKWLK